jgi:putative endonuclease
MPSQEKKIKGWSKKKKIELINSFNPQWKFLNYELLGEWPPAGAAHRREE